jgi:hypothetical protein
MRSIAIAALWGVAALLWPVGSKAEEAGKGFEWQPQQSDHIDLLYDGRPAMRYMMPTLDESSPAQRMATMKPFHHLYSPDGTALLTKGDADGLYPHHKGLFYGFNKITYGDGKTCDTWHCTGKAYQEPKRDMTLEFSKLAASQRVVIDWHGQDGEAFATENRRLSISRPVRQGFDGWQIDFRSHLATLDGKPIHLDGDPQHAGFHFRASQEVPDKTAKETYYVRTDGKGEPGDYRNWDPENPNSQASLECETRPWNAMSFVIGDNRYTAVYLDHPSNPKPSRYSERDYGRFGSYFVADVTKEKPLEVKYRLWVQEGEVTVEDCKSLHREFVNESSRQRDAAG